MGDDISGRMSPLMFILSTLYMLVPSIVLYLGGSYIDQPWILVLVVHWVFMVLLPWLFVEIFHFYRYGSVSYFYTSFGSAGDFTGLIMACCFCAITVAIYWIFCVPIGYDLKGTVQLMPFPDDTLWKILTIVYFILIKPHVEEFFWRRYNYVIFWVGELEFLLVSFCWALTYTVIAILAGADIMTAVIICLLFTAIGRFLIWIRWRYEVFANYLVHAGVCGGIVICYFLADAGKF